MNKRIRKKKIKLMIHERNIPMLKVYPPLEQFLDFQSTKELFTSWGKPPTRINIKRFWRYRTHHRDNNLYDYTKSTYKFLKEERSHRKTQEREFWKWLKEENNSRKDMIDNED